MNNQNQPLPEVSDSTKIALGIFFGALFAGIAIYQIPQFFDAFRFWPVFTCAICGVLSMLLLTYARDKKAEVFPDGFDGPRR